MARSRTTPALVPVPRVRVLNPETFFRKFYNRSPLVISGGARGWPAGARWTPEHLVETCGDVRVLVRQVKPGSTRTFIQQCMDQARLVPMRKFIRHVHGQPDEDLPGDPRSWSMRESRDVLASRPALLPDIPFESLFPGMDLHFAHSFWLGPAGYVTGLHVDLVDLNLLAHLQGRKTMTFYAPDQAPYLYAGPTVNGGVYSDVDAYEPDLERHPLFARARGWSTLLRPGDIVYVPRGFWHAVVAHTVTLSVSGLVNHLPAGIQRAA